MVGLLQKLAHRVPSHFRSAGDAVFLAGTTKGHLGGSAYWAEIHGFVGGAPPPVDLEAESRLQRFLQAAAAAGLLASAHDCSDGGLALALAEAAIGGPYADAPMGVSVDLTGYAPGVDAPALLYGEDGARAVLSCPPEVADRLGSLADEHGVPGTRIGTVGVPGSEVAITLKHETLRWSSSELRQCYFNAIPRRMGRIQANQSEGA
jgi:phosphoribosylformylglycinamidine synthase